MVTSTSAAVTVTLPASSVITAVEAHGKAAPGSGSTCVSGPSQLAGPGTFTFVPCPKITPE